MFHLHFVLKYFLFPQVPPNLLVKYGVSVSRTVQEPGQFLVVFPKTFTSYICTGYTISESVYYAPRDYLNMAEEEFRLVKLVWYIIENMLLNMFLLNRSIRESGEPMMFPYSKLLLCIAKDENTNKETLKRVIMQSFHS